MLRKPSVRPAHAVSAGTAIGEAGDITCRSGCSMSFVIGSVQFQCTDFSVDENWSAGQGSTEIKSEWSYKF